MNILLCFTPGYFTHQCANLTCAKTISRSNGTEDKHHNWSPLTADLSVEHLRHFSCGVTPFVAICVHACNRTNGNGLKGANVLRSKSFLRDMIDSVVTTMRSEGGCGLSYMHIDLTPLGFARDRTQFVSMYIDEHDKVDIASILHSAEWPVDFSSFLATLQHTHGTNLGIGTFITEILTHMTKGRTIVRPFTHIAYFLLQQFGSLLNYVLPYICCGAVANIDVMNCLEMQALLRKDCSGTL